MKNITEHFDEGVCPKCGVVILNSEFIQFYNNGVWINFGKLGQNLQLLYENDEIRHKKCNIVPKLVAP